MNALNAAERQKIIEDFERLTLADYKQLRTDLAAAKAEIEQLRSIISQNVIEVQRAKEEVRDKCAAKCESLFDKDDDTCDEAEQCAAAIRGMEL
jgi:hypothetical protein